MKKFLTIFFLIFVTSSVSAFSIDTICPPNKKAVFKMRKRLFSEDAVIFDVTSNLWLTVPSAIYQKPLQSLGYNISLFFDRPLGRSIFTLAGGIGYSVENIQNNGQWIYTSNYTQTFLYPMTLPYTSNRLTLHWFEVPVEVRLRTKGKGPFRFYLGAKAGLSVTHYYQFVDHDSKLREYNIKNINWYRYGVCARLGYAKFNLFAYYALSELFVHDHGPILTPASVGMSLILR